MIDTIVVGIDQTEFSLGALEWALTRAEGLRLVLARVVDDTIVAADYLVTPATIAAAQLALSALAESVRDENPGMEVSTALLRGDPITELSRLATSTVLLVVGTRARTASRLRYAWSVGTRLASIAPGPIAVIPIAPGPIAAGEVAAVPSAAGERTDAPPAGPVVVGTDGSESSAAAVRFAAEEALRAGVPLRLVHAWLEPTLYQDASLVADPDFFHSIEDSHRQILDSVVDGLRVEQPALEVHPELVHRAPAWALLESAQGASMLVVGNHGLTGLSRLLLGSVSHTVMLNLVSPTVVVKLEAESAPGA